MKDLEDAKKKKDDDYVDGKRSTNKRKNKNKKTPKSKSRNS